MWWAAIVFTAVAVGLGPYTGSGTSVWLGVGAGLFAWWVDIQLHPITRCWLCSGDPKVRDHKGTSWRNCAACGGSGRRRRLLARRER
jgi:hypothetical protein